MLKKMAHFKVVALRLNKSLGKRDDAVGNDLERRGQARSRVVGNMA